MGDKQLSPMFFYWQSFIKSATINRMNIDTNHFKEKLEEELKTLEIELASVGRKNPDNAKDWEAQVTDLTPDTAEESEVADYMEELEGNTAILKQLEIRYNEVKHALQKIADGKYGICEVSGEPIELERLEANPAARTMIAHMGKELPL